MFSLPWLFVATPELSALWLVKTRTIFLQTAFTESFTSQLCLWHFMEWIQISFFYSGTGSYLRREVMCSSDRPPSSSLTMNSLSFSSPGCTGKLLRKMSRRKIDWGGGSQYIQKYMKAFSLTDSLLILRWNDSKSIVKTKGPLLNYLRTNAWGKCTNLHPLKSKMMGFLFWFYKKYLCIIQEKQSLGGCFPKF